VPASVLRVLRIMVWDHLDSPRIIPWYPTIVNPADPRQHLGFTESHVGPYSGETVTGFCYPNNLPRHRAVTLHEPAPLSKRSYAS
jgi:hypothetical protein